MMTPAACKILDLPQAKRIELFNVSKIVAKAAPGDDALLFLFSALNWKGGDSNKPE